LGNELFASVIGQLRAQIPQAEPWADQVFHGQALTYSDEKEHAALSSWICQFQRYLRIRADRAEINANVAMLFANGVCERDLPRDSSMPSDLVMICQWASLFYAIDGFPGDDLLWRIEWLGGVGYNTSVPSEPQIDVSLAQLPKGERNPLSARARSSQVEKRTVGPAIELYCRAAI